MKSDSTVSNLVATSKSDQTQIPPFQTAMKFDVQVIADDGYISIIILL